MLCLPTIERKHCAPEQKRQDKHSNRPMRKSASKRQMLLPAKQRRYRINVWNIGRNNQRWHRKASFPLQAHLAEQCANEAMCKIIHLLALTETP